MTKQQWTYYFFLGIGGIGMSALARYLKFYGHNLIGYDANKTDITNKLQQEGINIFYDDNPNILPQNINSKNTLIIITPAIKKSNLLRYFTENNFKIIKRSQFLGQIANSHPLIAIAGTHGKTSTSAIISHILLQNNKLIAGFVGGIVKPYNTNLLLPDKQPENGFIVVEADEYDRSFLNLQPDISVVTSLEPDHLDIYSNINEIKEAFTLFIQQSKPKAKTIINYKVELNIPSNVAKYYYGLNDNLDFFANNIRIENNLQHFDLHLRDEKIQTYIQFPGQAYLENSIAAAAIAYLIGIDKKQIAHGLETYQGTKRRFDLRIDKNGKKVYDDYAHHPGEIKALYNSARQAFPDKKLTIVFQPHLYSRTRDLAQDFARALDNFDEIIITDIYPAREQPIPGVTPMSIIDQMKNPNKKYIPKTNLKQELQNKDFEILFITGAGDINLIINELNQMENNE